MYLYLFLTTSVIIDYVRAVSNGASCNSSWTFAIGCKTLTNLRAQMALKIYDGNFKGILDKKLKFPIYQTYSGSYQFVHRLFDVDAMKENEN